MQIFYLINGFAGHHPALDALMRFIYVAAVPLLATALAAGILLAPHSWMHPKAPSRRALLLASFLTLFLIVISIALTNAFEHFALGGKILSHRPFLTHFVTSLVMQPNNNSFPSFEVTFAAALAILLWAVKPRWGVVGWLVAATLAIAHLYCGTNFTIDVVIGLIWGIAVTGLALAICAIPLTFPFTKTTRLRWKPRFQGTAALLIMICTVIYVASWMANTPHQLPSLFTVFRGSSTAQAASKSDGANHRHDTISSKSTFTASAGSNDAPQKAREMLLLTDAVRQDGHLPEAEKYLFGVLQNQRTGMQILGVNVAEVKSGKTAYRSAAIRFEVQGEGNAVRRRVAAVATRLVKATFHADARIDYVDVLGMKKHLQHSELYTKGGTPVFTASIKRDSLILKGDRAWLNAPEVNPGLWLRARSLLYFHPQVLPSDEVFQVKEFLDK